MIIEPNTAIDVLIGPIQDTDGLRVTGLAFGSVTVALSKDGGAAVNMTLSAANWVEDADGRYILSLAAGDTDTEGNLHIDVESSGCLPFFDDIQIALPAGMDGQIAVDHNTGGTDALRYVDSGGSGVGGAVVRAYVKADYDAGTFTVRAKTVTNDDGRWEEPLYLAHEVSYTITFYKSGVGGPDAVEVTP